MAHRLKLLFFSLFLFLFQVNFDSTRKVQDSTLLNVSVCIYNIVRDWTLASHSHRSHMSVTKYKSCSGSRSDSLLCEGGRHRLVDDHRLVSGDQILDVDESVLSAVYFQLL